MSQTRRPAKKTAAKRASSKDAQVHNITSLGRRFVLSDVISEIQEERPGIEVEGANGTVFRIPTPELWSDKVTKLADKDPEACSKELLGDQYDDWIKQGGTFGVLNHIIIKSAGADVGKS